MDIEMPMTVVPNTIIPNAQSSQPQTELANHTPLPEQEHGSINILQPDRGKDAWLFLATCTSVEVLIWGFSFSFGVFQDYYTTHEPFSLSGNVSNVVAVSTSANGIMYMAGLLLFPAYKIFPRLASRSKWAGFPIMSVALIAASFANDVNQLILTQGVLFGIGGSIVYCPVLIFLDEWFVERKGFAYGFMWAGTGASGLVTPFLMNYLLDRYGFRIALRVWAVALIVLSAPLIYFLRPRLPLGARIGSSPDWRRVYGGLGFLLTSTFWLLQLGLLVESLGYFIPSIYLPSFARSLGLSSSIGTLLVALVNAASVLSTILMGMLVDRFHFTTVILLSTVGVTVSVFVLWGLSDALPPLVVFSISYGLFAGGFITTSIGGIKMIKARDETTDVGILMGAIAAARGIGALISGPLTDALLSKSWKAGFGYASGYGGLIVFTGTSAAMGGVSFVGKRLGWMG